MDLRDCERGDDPGEASSCDECWLEVALKNEKISLAPPVPERLEKRELESCSLRASRPHRWRAPSSPRRPTGSSSSSTNTSAECRRCSLIASNLQHKPFSFALQRHNKYFSLQFGSPHFAGLTVNGALNMKVVSDAGVGEDDKEGAGLNGECHKADTLGVEAERRAFPGTPTYRRRDGRKRYTS